MIFFAQLLLAVTLPTASVYCGLPSEKVTLPTYPPPLSVTDGRGDRLSKRTPPHLEFAEMQVRVAYMSIDDKVVWQPHSIDEAAFALREALPADFYDRLLAGYDRTHRRLFNPKDPAVIERVGDIANFVKNNWGTSWSKEQDAFKLLEEIVHHASVAPDRLPSRCAS